MIVPVKMRFTSINVSGFGPPTEWSVEFVFYVQPEKTIIRSGLPTFYDGILTIPPELQLCIDEQSYPEWFLVQTDIIPEMTIDVPAYLGGPVYQRLPFGVALHPRGYYGT